VLWDPKIREGEEEKDESMLIFLEYLFENDKGTVIAITSHSVVIAALLRVPGHRKFKPRVGNVFLFW
jgi:hypothetical protein